MSLLTIPYSFVAGTTEVSSQMNSNFTTIANLINGGLDYTNIGAAGIRPSQLSAGTVGDALISLGFSVQITPTAASVTGLTVTGVASQTADIFQVRLTSGGTIAFKIGSNGSVVWSGGTLTSYNSPVTALIIPAATGGFQIANAANTVTNLSLTDSGNLSIASTITATPSGGVAATVPVVYTPTSTGYGSGIKIFSGQTAVTFSASNTSAAFTVTLTGGASFSSSTSYQVIATASGVSGGNQSYILPWAVRSTGTSFILQAYNTLGSAVTISPVIDWIAIGN